MSFDRVIICIMALWTTGGAKGTINIPAKSGKIRFGNQLIFV